MWVGGVWNDKSHVAALFQNELYELKRTRESRHELIGFGVLYGHHRVVLYIEPDADALDVISNTARSSLLVSDGETGSPLPWSDWQAEFRTKLPQAIKEMMDDILSKADAGSHTDEVKKRLREIRDLFKLSRYRRTPNGSLAVDGFQPGGQVRTGTGTRRPATEVGSHPPVGGGQSDLYAAFLAPTGSPGEEVREADNTPIARWVSVDQGTRSVDQMEDRAASYAREENLILVNADFRGFKRVIELLASEYPHADPSDIRRTFESWTELQLTECVMGVMHLQGSPEWDSSQIFDNALSEEALTTAVMSRYATLSQMRRQLGARLGRA